MEKKIVLVVLALSLLFTCTVSLSEVVSEDSEEILGEYIDEMKESGRTFTIPLHIGPIYSVIVRKDGIGIVFNMVKSKAMELSLEAISFVTDLEEMDIALENGASFNIPAVVQLQSYDVGSFITLNLSAKATSTLIELLNQSSPIVKFTFVQGDGNKIDMTVDEVNKALSDASGTAVDIVNQAGTAAGEFFNNLGAGAGTFAADAYASVEQAVINAGDALIDAANDAGDFLGEAADSVGEFLGNTAESAGGALEDAAESVTDFWKGLWGN